MSATTVELTGTVDAEGVLVLDGPMKLEQGKAKVAVQPAPLELPKDDPFWQGMQAVWGGLRAMFAGQSRRSTQNCATCATSRPSAAAR